MPAPLRFLLGLALLAATALAGEAAQEAGFITHARQLIYEGRRSGEGAFSPDGKKLCWTSGRTAAGKSQLFLADWNDAAARAALAASAKVGGASQPRAGERSEAEGKNAHATPPTAAAGAAPARDWEVPPTVAAITRADLQAQAAWLADPAREGRATGSAGAQAAADWLAEYFKKAGLKPFGADYFQPFEFTAGERVIPEKCQLAITGAATLDGVLDRDFRPLPFSDNGAVEGEVVFAGYGLSVPEDGKSGRYNSYDGLDVKDKIVLLLRYVPEAVEAPRRAQLNRYSGLRYKAMMARERGAKAVLVVTGPNSPNAGELLPLANDGSNTGSGIIAASISTAVAEALLAPSGRKLQDLQTALDRESPHAEGGFVLPKTKVRLAAGVEHIRKSDRNVLAFLPPTGGSDEYILVGAHYDHLGRGAGSSMARAGQEGQVHPGADDNASGTAAVLELAAALAHDRAARDGQPQRGIIFALWSGEEIGLIGSAAFCEKPPVPLAKIAAYVNFDMVGRLRENKLTLQGVGSSKRWRRLIEKRNVAAGFNLTLQDDPYLPTDTTSLYPKRIPVLNFFTGAHEDYHRPTDTADRLNLEGLERIAQFARQLVLDLASAPERPDFARVERSAAGAGARDTLRAYLGSIPDYSTEVKGVKLSGVRAGSPAEKGGLKGGDVIVEFAGQKIANIYDYTYALDAVKIGTPVKVSIERDGQRVELTVTPEARK